MNEFHPTYAQVQVVTCLASDDEKTYHRAYRVSTFDSNGIPTHTYHETLVAALGAVTAGLLDSLGETEHGTR